MLVVVNMECTGKQPLFGVGKSKQPLCFRGIPSAFNSVCQQWHALMTASFYVSG